MNKQIILKYPLHSLDLQRSTKRFMIHLDLRQSYCISEFLYNTEKNTLVKFLKNVERDCCMVDHRLFPNFRYFPSINPPFACITQRMVMFNLNWLSTRTPHASMHRLRTDKPTLHLRLTRGAFLLFDTLYWPNRAELLPYRVKQGKPSTSRLDVLRTKDPPFCEPITLHAKQTTKPGHVWIGPSAVLGSIIFLINSSMNLLRS